MKKVYAQRQSRYVGQQPGTKSGRRPGDKPVINRLSTAGFVPPSVYIGFPLFVLPRKRSGQLSSMPWGARGSVVSTDPSASRPVRSRSALPPRRPALRRPEPFSPWYVRVLDSTG